MSTKCVVSGVLGILTSALRRDCREDMVLVLNVVSLLSCLESEGLADLEDRNLMRVRFCSRESDWCWIVRQLAVVASLTGVGS